MTPEPVGWIPLVLAVTALVLAATAIVAILYCLFTAADDGDPEPPVWVNDGGRIP